MSGFSGACPCRTLSPASLISSQFTEKCKKEVDFVFGCIRNIKTEEKSNGTSLTTIGNGVFQETFSCVKTPPREMQRSD